MKITSLTIVPHYTQHSRGVVQVKASGKDSRSATNSLSLLMLRGKKKRGVKEFNSRVGRLGRNDVDD